MIPIMLSKCKQDQISNIRGPNLTSIFSGHPTVFFLVIHIYTRGLIYKMLRRNHPKFVLRSFRKSA